MVRRWARTTRATSLADLDSALVGQSVAQADALAEYFSRASSLALLLAHDFSLHRSQPSSRSQTDVATAQSALAHLEQLHPGRISEVCLIDRSGAELARVVSGAAPVQGFHLARPMTADALDDWLAARRVASLA